MTYTTNAVAELLRVTDYSVRRLCDKHNIGTLHGGKPMKDGRISGGRWVITEADLEQLKVLAKPGFGRPKDKKRSRKSKPANG